ncbi:MAG: hypothetical protein RL011_1692 [Pseudomonadota bacterium]
MRMFGRRWLGASLLALSFSFGIVGCSGDQGTEEAVEGSENQAADESGGGDAAAGEEGDGSGGNNATAEDGAAAADAEAANAATGGENAEAVANAGAAGSGENDLQDIITEMNGQQPAGDNAAAEAAAGDAAAPAADAAAAPAGDAATPAAAPANATASAAPAAAPAASAPASMALPQQPGGSPAAAGLPELGSKMAYIVEPGDTLAKISQKIYGAPGRWQEMATLSGLANPSKIYPGDVIYYTLEEGALAFAKAYDAVQRAEEQVQPGDTLATISKRVYGETSGWRSIWRHNDNIDDPDVVQSGTTVYYVPRGAVQAALTKFKSEAAKIAQIKSQPANKLVVKAKSTASSAAKGATAAKKMITNSKSLNNLDAHRV